MHIVLASGEDIALDALAEDPRYIELSHRRNIALEAHELTAKCKPIRTLADLVPDNENPLRPNNRVCVAIQGDIPLPSSSDKAWAFTPGMRASVEVELFGDCVGFQYRRGRYRS